MPRYVAFLRGVSPMNCKMPDLKRCFEKAGFADVRTVLSSGNVLFTAVSKTESTLARKIEAAIKEHLGLIFGTMVRSIEHLESILESNPFQEFKLKPGSKRVVTFFKDNFETKIKLPIEKEGARILKVDGRESFTAYVPMPGNPVFMTLIEKTFGKEVTTRTWETLQKVVKK